MGRIKDFIEKCTYQDVSFRQLFKKYWLYYGAAWGLHIFSWILQITPEIEYFELLVDLLNQVKDYSLEMFLIVLFVFVLALVVIIPALEEVFFRIIPFRATKWIGKKLNRDWKIQGAIFALAGTVIWISQHPYNLLAVIPLGVFSWRLVISGHYRDSIIFHMITNAIFILEVIILLFLF